LNSIDYRLPKPDAGIDSLPPVWRSVGRSIFRNFSSFPMVAVPVKVSYFTGLHCQSQNLPALWGFTSPLSGTSLQKSHVIRPIIIINT
jgi:hypothetical protein